MELLHQCLTCGKTFKSLEEAQKCHEGPTQSFYKGVTTFSKKKGLLGN